MHILLPETDHKKYFMSNLQEIRLPVPGGLSLGPPDRQTSIGATEAGPDQSVAKKTLFWALLVDI